MDLTKLAAIRADYPTLLEDIVPLAKAIVDDKNNTKNNQTIIPAVVSNPALLERRRSRRDLERADVLLNEAWTTACRLKMTTLMDRIREQRH